jgi:hypothetical protein
MGDFEWTFIIDLMFCLRLRKRFRVLPNLLVSGGRQKLKPFSAKHEGVFQDGMVRQRVSECRHPLWNPRIRALKINKYLFRGTA